MPRKIILDSSNTLGVWIQKQNLMSDYMGNLDSLSSAIKDRRPGFRDSSFVTALNGIWDSNLEQVYLATLVPGPGGRVAVLRNFTSPLYVDSATFGKIDIGHLFAADAHVADSWERGDSAGATGKTVASFLYDLHIADSATFNNMKAVEVDGTNLDSALFKNIHLDSSATMIVDTFDPPDSSTITFHGLSVLNISTVDSATIGDIVTKNLQADSAYFKFGIIDSATINNDITIDGIKFDGVSEIQVVDKNGTQIFGGYLLDSV